MSGSSAWLRFHRKLQSRANPVDTNRTPRPACGSSCSRMATTRRATRWVDIRGRTPLPDLLRRCEVALLSDKIHGHGGSRHHRAGGRGRRGCVALGVENGHGRTCTTTSRRQPCGYAWRSWGAPTWASPPCSTTSSGQKLTSPRASQQTTRLLCSGSRPGARCRPSTSIRPACTRAAKGPHRYMNRTASAALKDVGSGGLNGRPARWTEEGPDGPWSACSTSVVVLIAVVNKTDRIEEGADLLLHLRWLTQRLPKVG